MLNSGHIRNKIEKGPGLQALLKPGTGIGESASGLYLAILSRSPTDEELRAVDAYARSGVVSESQAAVDVAWALVNSMEFLYRH
jgi:hypothetical protein